MGGGLFGTPLYLNPKCLVFSLFVLCVYWLPKPTHWQHQYVMAFLLATSAYILLAWYDVLFDCNDRLRPTILGWLSAPFKPSEYSEEYKKLPLKYQKIIRSIDILLLSVVIITFLYPYKKYFNF
jgi:UDP-N-acetylmuramyl pentapeptide phosphotransferase/UDP-N-acetylglucosamine-1-phosphate transferase